MENKKVTYRWTVHWTRCGVRKCGSDNLTHTVITDDLYNFGDFVKDLFGKYGIHGTFEFDGKNTYTVSYNDGTVFIYEIISEELTDEIVKRKKGKNQSEFLECWRINYEKYV